MPPEMPKALPVQSFDQSLLGQKLSIILGPHDFQRSVERRRWFEPSWDGHERSLKSQSLKELEQPGSWGWGISRNPMNLWVRLMSVISRLENHWGIFFCWDSIIVHGPIGEAHAFSAARRKNDEASSSFTSGSIAPRSDPRVPKVSETLLAFESLCLWKGKAVSQESHAQVDSAVLHCYYYYHHIAIN